MKKAAIVISSILGAISTLILALFVYYFSVTANVRLDKSKLNDRISNVRVLDCRGNEIDLPAVKKCTALSTLPSYVPNAFVAVEDKRFYTHRGFDYKRIGKAILRNLSSFSFREGASTLSQQLVKNTHLTGEKTLNRKFKEMKLTRTLEKRYSKEEILSLYLNSIYFGHGAFGIEEAANVYFRKSARELTPAESATLAALVKSPNRYSPFRNEEKCFKRRNFVLSLMRDQGYISSGEYSAAIQEALPKEEDEKNENGQSYLSLVFEELAEIFPSEKPDCSSLTIYTYYDPALQKTMEDYKAETDYSACVLDNLTHGIKAYVSSVGKIKRLPASLIKPLLVYAPALEKNTISPATPLLDERTAFGDYSPKNYGDRYEGYVSARYALSRSLNVPAVKLLNAIGIDEGAEYLKRMNLPVPNCDRSLALALGGMSEGYDLPSLAFAYSVFPAMGNYSPFRTIRKIESASKKIVYIWKPSFVRVFSEDTAAIMNDMLKTTVADGTAKKLRSLAFPIAAKTGTGANSSGNVDAYAVSYTSENTVAVWMGMRDNSPVQTTGGDLPAALALILNRQLYSNRAPQDFALSNDVVTLSFDKEEYEKNHRIVAADPAAPPVTTLCELFRSCALPTATSTRFSRPEIEKPEIFVKNGSVLIILRQTEYYDYVIKRKNNGKTIILYEGNYRSTIIDNSVLTGETYEYVVTPVYRGREGTPQILPSVHIQKQTSIPDDWWKKS